MARFLVLIVLSLLAGAALADERNAASAEPARKIALVIGNSGYANALPLPNSLNDANDLCGALRKLDFEVICKLDVPSKRAFKDAIFEFTGKIDAKSAALFYFAGHGVQIDGLNYLIPTGAALRTKSDIEDESVQINYLMSELDTRHAALNVFLLDACRNNPFVSPVRGYVPSLGMASQLYAPRNSVIAMSTGPGQLSLDGMGRNGTFTNNLLKFIATPRQPLEDMLKAVSGGTRAEASQLGRQQEPQLTTSYADRFCMAGCGDKRPVVDSRFLTKSAELDKITLTLAQTAAKRQELEQQKAALLKKREEVDALQRGLESAPAAPATATRASGDAQARAAARELDEMRSAMRTKQAELDAALEKLSVQQAAAEASDEKLRTRTIAPPEETRKPMTIIPAF